MNEITKNIQNEEPWDMLFADDVALIGKCSEEVKGKLKEWMKILEGKGFKIDMSKTEYIMYELKDI